MLARRPNPLADIEASFSSGLRWYVVMTAPARELAAGESIRDLGYSTFIPMEKRVQRRPNRKPRRYEAPLFSRYVFVEMDINRDEWGELLDADGVIDLLRTCNVPRCVPQHKIDALKLADSMGVFDQTQPIKVGMSVEITEGPFATFIGKITRARGSERAKVLLNLFGGEIETDVPMAALRSA